MSLALIRWIALALLVVVGAGAALAAPAPHARASLPETYFVESVWPLSVAGVAAAPAGLTIAPDGGLYTASARFVPTTAQDSLARVGPDGSLASVVTSSNFANAIGVDGSGRLYRLLADRLLRYASDGQDPQTAQGALTAATSLAVVGAPAGPIVYVAAGSGLTRFVNFKQDITWSAGVSLTAPIAVAAAPDGMLVVADAATRQVIHLATNGAPVGMPFTLAEQAGPLRVAVGPDGSIFVLTTDSQVQKYAPDGTLLASWGAAGSQPGQFLYPRDIAVGADGRVYVADTDNRRLQVFRSLVAGEATPTPMPTPNPNPPCLALPDKVISPSTIVLGETARVSLGVRSSCAVQTQPADIVVVMDTSLSMAEDDKSVLAKEAAQNFVEVLNLGQDQVGLAEFNDPENTRIVQPLGRDRYRVQRSLAELGLIGGTDLAAAIRVSQTELTGPRHHPGNAAVMILLTDGQSPRAPALAAAEVAKAAGTQIFAIGIGRDVNQNLLEAIASPGLYFYTRTGEDLVDIYQEIARVVQATDIQDVVITDTLRSDVQVYGYSDPSPSINGKTLTWRVDTLPLQGITVTYQIRPGVAGEYPPSVGPAAGSFVTQDGTPEAFPFPNPVLRVLQPTATPTATPTITPTPTPTRTPTPSPTPVVYRTYMPLLSTFQGRN